MAISVIAAVRQPISRSPAPLPITARSAPTRQLRNLGATLTIPEANLAEPASNGAMDAKASPVPCQPTHSPNCYSVPAGVQAGDCRGSNPVVPAPGRAASRPMRSASQCPTSRPSSTTSPPARPPSLAGGGGAADRPGNTGPPGIADASAGIGVEGATGGSRCTWSGAEGVCTGTGAADIAWGVSTPRTAGIATRDTEAGAAANASTDISTRGAPAGAAAGTAGAAGFATFNDGTAPEPRPVTGPPACPVACGAIDKGRTAAGVVMAGPMEAATAGCARGSAVGATDWETAATAGTATGEAAACTVLRTGSVAAEAEAGAVLTPCNSDAARAAASGAVGARATSTGAAASAGASPTPPAAAADAGRPTRAATAACCVTVAACRACAISACSPPALAATATSSARSSRMMTSSPALTPSCNARLIPIS